MCIVMCSTWFVVQFLKIHTISLTILLLIGRRPWFPFLICSSGMSQAKLTKGSGKKLVPTDFWGIYCIFSFFNFFGVHSTCTAFIQFSKSHTISDKFFCSSVNNLQVPFQISFFCHLTQQSWQLCQIYWLP